jgi:predicted O-linked N-acetylglucosamine transferase (SPINDLY family)
MGVPVVALLGDTLMSRWTASMLHQVGLDDLIAKSPEEYVEIALKLAADRDRLAELRATLRDRVAKSLLCDGAKTTRYFERALRAVWRKWCSDAENGAAIAPPSGCAARG